MAVLAEAGANESRALASNNKVGNTFSKLNINEKDKDGNGEISQSAQHCYKT